VRGAGQFTGLELVTSRTTKEPATVLALDVIEGMRERGVLTSVAGPGGNILKLRPTLAFRSADIDWLIGSFEDALVQAL
jgi:4-aminobutyrate aminotransferase-like enzyme